MQENQNIIANALSSDITGIFNREEKFYSYNGRCPNLIDKFLSSTFPGTCSKLKSLLFSIIFSLLYF